MLINSYVEPRGWGRSGVVRIEKKGDGVGEGKMGGIIVVKPLFPPGKKKEVNDTLELLTHTHHPSLSFMEGRCDTLFSAVRRPGRQPCRPAITKREKEEV